MRLEYVQSFIKNLDKAPPIVPYWEREVALMLACAARFGTALHSQMLRSFQEKSIITGTGWT